MLTTLKNDRGVALVVIIFVVSVLLTLTGASLLFSGLNLKTASNLSTGGGALHAADAGIQHTLTLIPTGTTFSYSSQTTLLNNNSFASGYSYTVTAVNDQASGGGNTRVILTSTASGPNKSVRKVQAYIGRSTSSWSPPGTVYIPAGAGSDANFNTSGTLFITGNDTAYSADSNHDGRADSTSAGPNSAIYGVATTNSDINTQFINGLTSTEKTKVQGLGYNAATSPVTPSVFTTSNPLDVTSLANNLKSQPGVVPLSSFHRTSSDCPTPPPSYPISSNCALGTDDAPQITYINSTSTIKTDPDSTVVGSGVLILEGKANLFGNFEFHGIVISLKAGPRGDESTEDKLKLKLKDNARIFGSVLLGPNSDELKFDIKDNASIYYSSQALNLVKNLWGSCCLSQPARLIAWQEVMQ